MHLKIYLENAKRGEATRLARELHISTSYLSQLVSGAASVSPARCIEIEKVTGGAVTRADMRPDDWHKIWPEFTVS
ncbi:transcriptional regulator [Pantoea osteomyelitidis]|uniref:Transcriptional regulator n=1 Tax=Pantoea osteomyelitidis TaxID=3230026 RepID=A0ABW7PV59_9GAMM